MINSDFFQNSVEYSDSKRLVRICSEIEKMDMYV